MATLYILNPDLPEQELWFDPASADIIIGSDPSCQVVVNHPTIAPQHTRILTHEGYVWIQDLESGFGTYQLGEALTSVYLEAEKSYHFNIGQVDLVIFLNNNDQAIQQTQPAPENSLRSQLLLRNQQITQPTITPQPVPAANNIQVQQQTADHEDKAKKLQATALKRAQIKKRKKSSGGAGFLIFVLAIIAFAAGLYFKHEQLGTGQNLLHAIQEPAKHYELIKADSNSSQTNTEATSAEESSMDSMN